MSYQEFPPDTFTEADVLRCLDFAGERYQVKGRYIVTTCPMPEHADKNPSAQIYRSDWWVNCHAGCGRFHITKAYPELRNNTNGTVVPQTRKNPMTPKTEEPKKHIDLIEQWRALPLIPRDHQFKGGIIPLEVLDSMGWRYDASRDGYFIPYFHFTQEHVPYAQWRLLSGTKSKPTQRFSFPSGASVTMYGKWNLPDATLLFLVEGASDAACLEYAGVPWIAVPSVGSVGLIAPFASYCIKHGIQVVYAGDNDTEENNYAGDKVREALASSMPRYRICQPPKQYKDWCDFLAAEGIEAVREYTKPELGVPQVPSSPVDTFGISEDESLDVDAVFAMFPGAKVVA